MKLTSTTKELLLVALLITFVLPTTVLARTLTIASDKYWTVTDSTGLALGNAQNICRFTGAPEGCPQGATLFGSPNWVSIPSANWIWKPGTTGTSSATANEKLTFKTPFYLCGSPQSASISVAADNSTEVFVNGTLILSTQSFSTVTTVAIPANRLAQGINMIEAKVTNAANPPGCSDQYQCNPAGVAVKLTVTDNLDPWPTCMDGNKTFQVGEFQDLSCPPGQEGSNSRACVCIGNFATWWGASNTCHTPPPPPVTCTGANNTTFGVNATESVSCPAGQIGNAFHTCQSNGQWSASDFSGCTLPPANRGEWCGDRNQGQVRSCPTGTTCAHRMATPGSKPPAWCIACGIFTLGLCTLADVCNGTPSTWTTDWFCD